MCIRYFFLLLEFLEASMNSDSLINDAQVEILNIALFFHFFFFAKFPFKSQIFSSYLRDFFHLFNKFTFFFYV